MVTKNRWAALGFALGLATLFAAALPGAGRAQPAIRLYAMDCGHAAFTDAGPLADNGAFKGVARELIVPCFLIRHPNGDLIWDTGVAEALATIAGQDWPVPPRILITGSLYLAGRVLAANGTPPD